MKARSGGQIGVGAGQQPVDDLDELPVGVVHGLEPSRKASVHGKPC
jgi:hypothetical protein